MNVRFSPEIESQMYPGVEQSVVSDIGQIALIFSNEVEEMKWINDMKMMSVWDIYEQSFICTNDNIRKYDR